MKNMILLSQAKQVGETQRGECFDRVTMQAPFTGAFDAKRMHDALSPNYSGLHRPVSIDFYSVREVSPGMVEWVRILSNGD